MSQQFLLDDSLSLLGFDILTDLLFVASTHLLNFIGVFTLSSFSRFECHDFLIKGNFRCFFNLLSYFFLRQDCLLLLV
jgi:hypothetical protein